MIRTPDPLISPCNPKMRMSGSMPLHKTHHSRVMTYGCGCCAISVVENSMKRFVDEQEPSTGKNILQERGEERGLRLKKLKLLQQRSLCLNWFTKWHVMGSSQLY